MKTTKEDFEYFKRKCELWAEVFSLASWEIDYFHEKAEGALADCSTNYTGRRASIRLANDWNIPVTKKELSVTALHEMLELLLSPLMSLAQARVWDIEEYIKENHVVIRTLEKLFVHKTGKRNQR